MITLNLGQDWQVRAERLETGAESLAKILKKEEDWMYADLPCDVHMPLINNGIIKEPLEGLNCYDSQWIEERSWWFKKCFQVEKEMMDNDIIEMTLESLDCEADIFLNGTHLGHHHSAFYPFEFEVKKELIIGENILVVRVSSGLEYHSELEIADIKACICSEANGGRGDRGDERRAYVRKPQYVYGWDWGPRVASCGIMKSVYIKANDGFVIRDVNTVTKVAEENAILEFSIEMENFNEISTGETQLTVEVIYGDEIVSNLAKNVLLRSGVNYFDLELFVKEAKLWWPSGMGDQSLYTIKVYASTGDRVYEYPPFKFGIRTVTICQDKINNVERKFTFLMNGVNMYCKGGNWVPADSIYARVTDDKYDNLICEARQANFNMLRVWGGGIYERDIFYEKCDEYGILLWHDFMFACSMYPDNLKWFRTEVENEVDYQTRRLRKHACIGIWSGSNENSWGFDEWWDGLATFQGGAKCYNQIIPRIVNRNCPQIPYWNGSPYGGAHPNGYEMGDKHHWQECTMGPDMGRRITPEEYDKVTAKFVSEYGYIGPTGKGTIERYLGGVTLDSNDKAWKHHTCTYEKDTIIAGIQKHYIDQSMSEISLDDYLLYGGLCQGLMYEYSLDAMRFKENCSGSLIWMYADCWGEIGWTVMDYYEKRKPSYYFVKRALTHIRLIMREIAGLIYVVGANDTADNISFEADYGYVNYDGSNKQTSSISVTLAPYSRATIAEFDMKNYSTDHGIFFISPSSESNRILPATLRSGVYKEQNMPKAKLKCQKNQEYQTNHTKQINLANDNYLEQAITVTEFIISTDTYAHAVHFNLGDEYKLSDEYFELLPGESRQIKVYGTSGSLNINIIKGRCVNEE